MFSHAVLDNLPDVLPSVGNKGTTQRLHMRKNEPHEQLLGDETPGGPYPTMFICLVFPGPEFTTLKPVNQ